MNRRGLCLSKEYVNTNTKLEWQCAEGHTWLARPTDLISNEWCPPCARSKKKFNKTRQLTC